MGQIGSRKRTMAFKRVGQNPKCPIALQVAAGAILSGSRSGSGAGRARGGRACAVAIKRPGRSQAIESHPEPTQPQTHPNPLLRHTHTHTSFQRGSLGCWASGINPSADLQAIQVRPMSSELATVPQIERCLTDISRRLCQASSPGDEESRP